MLKVIIVDDEPSVLEGLRLFVDWNKEGYEIAGEASDGISAYPMIREIKPDLIICDIRMPGLTGLELIEKINAGLNPIPKFLMLSGYNDFSYARKALELGAIGYLTKPLDSDELSTELGRVTEMIENNRKSNLEHLEMLRYAANQIYNDFIGGKHSDKLIRKAKFIFGLPENANIRMIRYITTPDNDRGTINTSDAYDLLLTVTGIENENCVFYNGNGIYIALLHEGMQHFPSYKILAERFVHHFRQSTRESTALQSSWALISAVGSPGLPEGISYCDRQIDQLQTWCMLHPENKVICYETFEASPDFLDETKLQAVLPEQAYDQIASAIQGNDEKLVNLAVEDFFTNLNQNVGQGSFSSVCLYRLADVVRKTASVYGIEVGTALLDFINSISVRSPNCKNLVLAMCTHVFKKLNSNHDKPIVMLENEIIEYIKANSRRKNISIQGIGAYFSIPVMIISKTIKKKTGYKFNDYINYLRIEYAKTLFATEDIKVTTVCDEAGYSDYGYFTRKFKEFTGVLPSEYKKKYS
ncbi:MAG: response regulator [Ruminiclostridium sp.]|nr:response regulator [Ruminiclostridium sp.]